MALANAFQAEGASGIASARSERSLAALRDANLHFQVIQCDVSDEAFIQAAVGELKQLGRLFDILVNNAGVMYDHDFTGAPDKGRFAGRAARVLSGQLC